MKRVMQIILALAIVGALGFVFVRFYPYLFKKDVIGEIVEVERVTEPTAILGGVPASQVYSFAIAVKNPSGEIFTASSEDRQWAVAKKGMCVEAVYYPYPPWDLDKSGTYYNARLIKLMDCAR